MGRYFGTDGIRGRANEKFDANNGGLDANRAFQVGRYLGYYYSKEGRRRILIGKDTRLSSGMIYYLDENPGIEPKFGDTAAGGIAQALYDKEENSFLMLNSSAALSAETEDSIRSNIAAGVSGTRDYSVTVTDAGVPSTSYLYSITETTDGRYLVSLMTDTYREEFRNSLVKSVINMSATSRT